MPYTDLRQVSHKDMPLRLCLSLLLHLPTPSLAVTPSRQTASRARSSCPFPRRPIAASLVLEATPVMRDISGRSTWDWDCPVHSASLGVLAAALWQDKKQAHSPCDRSMYISYALPSYLGITSPSTSSPISHFLKAEPLLPIHLALALPYFSPSLTQSRHGFNVARCV